jgi:hypothetical protein
LAALLRQAVRIGNGGRRKVFDLRGGSGCEQIVEFGERIGDAVGAGGRIR